jgi:ABC-type transport system substrate-binding protein
MKRITFLITLLALLLLAGSVLAMDSENYSLDWFTLITGSGGSTDSANYAVSFTVGQTVIGDPDSANYASCLGYWCGGAAEYKIYLPLVLRNT